MLFTYLRPATQHINTLSDLYNRMFPEVNTKCPEAVHSSVDAVFRRLFPNAATDLIIRLFADVTEMFAGRYMDYQAIDIGYHDFEHTLQATLCFAQIFAGRHDAKAQPALKPRHFELGLAATLLHDTGYLKLRSDTDGSSAKYTHVHVLRSAAFAASYVPTVGFDAAEADIIAAAINCTGPSHRFIHLLFDDYESKLLGSMLVTADYLGQMAAADYPDELQTLFREFAESDNFFRLPPAERAFSSENDLIRKTRSFWEKFVLPKLETEYEGVFRYLAKPYPGGINPYVNAIEQNLSVIEGRIKAQRSIS